MTGAYRPRIATRAEHAAKTRRLVGGPALRDVAEFDNLVPSEGFEMETPGVTSSRRAQPIVSDQRGRMSFVRLRDLDQPPRGWRKVRVCSQS